MPKAVWWVSAVVISTALLIAGCSSAPTSASPSSRSTSIHIPQSFDGITLGEPLSAISYHLYPDSQYSSPIGLNAFSYSGTSLSHTSYYVVFPLSSPPSSEVSNILAKDIGGGNVFDLGIPIAPSGNAFDSLQDTWSTWVQTEPVYIGVWHNKVGSISAWLSIDPSVSPSNFLASATRKYGPISQHSTSSDPSQYLTLYKWIWKSNTFELEVTDSENNDAGVQDYYQLHLVDLPLASSFQQYWSNADANQANQQSQSQQQQVQQNLP